MADNPTDPEESDAPEEVAEVEAARRESKKGEIIETLFNRLWPEGQPRPAQPLIVLADDVRSAIAERNKKHPDDPKGLSVGNAANFLKDFIRHKSCNANWPKRLTAQRITAKQRYGAKQVMEFVDFGDIADAVPFPDRFDPLPDTPVIEFESLSIPVEARALGRQDEPWLIQVIVGQRLVETHFAVIASKSGLDVDRLAHLQMSVKTQPEIDATFIATLKRKTDDGRHVRAYVTCEAKQHNERILEDQIREQVRVAFRTTAELDGPEAIDAVIPLVFQIANYSKDGQTLRGIYVAQFEMMGRADFAAKYAGDRLHTWELNVQSRAFYQPTPPIRGISYRNAPKVRAKPAPKVRARPERSANRKASAH